MHVDMVSAFVLSSSTKPQKSSSHSKHRFRYNNTECRLTAALDSSSLRIRLSLIDVIITLGKRNIACRGNWNKEAPEDDGNVMFFVNWKSSFDLVLKEHIEQKISLEWSARRPLFSPNAFFQSL
jgi:hypothetical protein